MINYGGGLIFPDAYGGVADIPGYYDEPEDPQPEDDDEAAWLEFLSSLPEAGVRG